MNQSKRGDEREPAVLNYMCVYFNWIEEIQIVEVIASGAGVFA